MPRSGYGITGLPSKPRWFEGIPYVSFENPRRIRLHYPTVHQVCGPLDGVRVHGKGGVWVRYPNIPTARLLYRMGIELVHLRDDPADLVTLAMYRRQIAYVTKKICRVKKSVFEDELFLKVADMLSVAPSQEQWLDIASRMPTDSWIEYVCYLRAQVRGTPEKLAAD